MRMCDNTPIMQVHNYDVAGMQFPELKAGKSWDIHTPRHGIRHRYAKSMLHIEPSRYRPGGPGDYNMGRAGVAPRRRSGAADYHGYC